eukprot:577870-Amphidinium_carterae.2
MSWSGAYVVALLSLWRGRYRERTAAGAFGLSSPREAANSTICGEAKCAAIRGRAYMVTNCP